MPVNLNTPTAEVLGRFYSEMLAANLPIETANLVVLNAARDIIQTDGLAARDAR